ncbi:MAG: DNA polymerase III subunit delta [Candidatus Dadabacteria bacterium]|nr:DNA polymerase III subunit delta [Candidatus Dadabacteria bacterium]MDE0477383.1 DNA polymerase III subunit delta [Candidatus Dadabacteria bacterium]
MPSEKSIDIHPVTVLKSAQSLLVEDFIEKLTEELSAGSPKLLVESKNLDDTSLQEIVEDARTLPMFHERKLIVAKGYDGLGKDDLALLNEYAGAPASSSVLVLLSGGTRKAKTKPAKGIKLVDLDGGSKPEQEIRRLGERLGISLTPGAVSFVKTMLGEDMNLIKNELGKISLYVDGKKPVGEKELRGLIEKRSTENVFSLSTALSNRDLKGSLRILRELERNREDPLSILYMIAWRFRQIFKVSQHLREGKSDEAIAKAIKTSRGAVFYLKKSVRNFRENDLGRILELIEETDFGIKNSSGNNYILLEKLLLGICARET